VAETYYARRAARDPAWRVRQLVEAAERERRRRKHDPDGFRAARRAATQRCREQQVAHGRTFTELLRSTGADPAVLATVLRQEVERGIVEYHSTSRRYVLNGALPPSVKRALRDL
jgi:hypothetical protein